MVIKNKLRRSNCYWFKCFQFRRFQIRNIALAWWLVSHSPDIEGVQEWVVGMSLPLPILFPTCVCVSGFFPDVDVNLKVEKALKLYNSMKWNYLFQAYEVLFENKPYFISRCMGRTKKMIHFILDIGEIKLPVISE